MRFGVLVSAAIAVAGCGAPGESGGTMPLPTSPVPTTAGSAGASMGTGGTPSVPATTSVVPTLNGTVYRFQTGELAFEVDSAVAGRVVSFALGSQDTLTGPEINPTAPDIYGSTFWTSPQSNWVPNWPPPAVINAAPFAAAVDGDTLTLSGNMPEPTLGVSVSKRFRVDAASSSVTIEYSIFNRSAAAVQAAPWEISRVAAGGLSFFASGPGGVYPQTQLTVSSAAGATWFDHVATPPLGDHKLFADGAGWIAHVTGDLIFIKRFEDVPMLAQAPAEGEIELFANVLRTYVEVEAQGPFVSLAVGASSSWVVTWYLRRLPTNVSRTAGSQTLIDFVNQVFAGG